MRPVFAVFKVSIGLYGDAETNHAVDSALTSAFKKQQ